MSDVQYRIALKLAVEGEGWGNRIVQNIKIWAASGMNEEEILKKVIRDMSPGGQTFEQVMNGFRNATGESVDYVSIEQVHSGWTGPDKWMWVTISDQRRCEDCAERDNQVKTWAEWEAMGLPGIGTTRCGWRCRCDLVPQRYAEETAKGLEQAQEYEDRIGF